MKFINFTQFSQKFACGIIICIICSAICSLKHNLLYTMYCSYSEMLYRLQSELEHLPLDKPLPIPGSSSCHITIPSQIIPNLFEGQLYSEVKYLTCGHTSITTETFWDLSIDFPERYVIPHSCHVFVHETIISPFSRMLEIEHSHEL